MEVVAVSAAFAAGSFIFYLIFSDGSKKEVNREKWQDERRKIEQNGKK